MAGDANTQESPARVWLVEDSPRFTDAIAQLLGETEDFDLVETFHSKEAMDQFLARGRVTLPGLVLMDLKLPGGESGVAAIKALHRLYPDLPIVALSSQDTAEDVFETLRAGARGYIVKGGKPQVLLAAFRQAVNGGSYFSPSVARHVLGHFDRHARSSESLTAREVEVLKALASGESHATIAEKLYLSPHTIDSHVRNLYRKLHVRTAAAAAAKGVRRGLI